ncbi:MAG: zinc-ribbon domain-containing protein [Candidatus Pacebacteria bacterium]|nr:zinc-ribbon domain-containing protein [Candidatus Paceibacterota bacterium]
MPKKEPLSITHPELSKEWHPTKNKPLTPKDVTFGSGKKVWWKCFNGEDHVWKQKVCHRTNGSGCPFCSGRKASKEYSFFTENPKASDEWHPLKNGKLKPYEISPNHVNKVWWLCKRGHEWQATPNGRMRGRGCPYCHSKTSVMELMVYSEIKWIFEKVYLRKKVFNQECDVFISELPLAIEIDGVFWHKDRRKKDKLKNKVLSDNSIPIIRLREANLPKIENHDIIYKYGTDELPPIIKLVEFINIYFNLSKNKRINSYLGDKVLKNEKFFMELLDRLPDPLPGTSLMELNPNLVKEWHLTKNGNLTPDKITPGSTKKIWWECNKGHEWTAKSAARTGKKKTGCPFCTHQKVGYGNDLASSYPEIAEQWNYKKNRSTSPLKVIAGGTKKYWWVCKNNHEWQATTEKRIAGRNCPYCANRVVGYGNDLKSNYPDIAAQWNYKKNNILPEKILPHSGKKYWWICENNHEWEASPDKRLNGSCCPYCANRKIGYGNDLQSLYPEIANQWHPIKNGNLEPSKVVPGSGKKVWWICERKHEWQAMVHVRAIRGDGKCKECKK